MELLNYKTLLYGVAVVLRTNFAVNPAPSEKRSNLFRLTYAEVDSDADFEEDGYRKRFKILITQLSLFNILMLSLICIDCSIISKTSAIDTL